MSGKPSASCVRTETPLCTTSPRVRAMTSRIASLISRPSFRGGAFLMRARIRSTTEPAQSGLCVGDRRADRLVDFMCNRSRQLPHRRDAIGVREFRLHGAQGFFGPLTFGDVPPDAAVADEAPRLVKHRQPRDGHVTLAAVGGRPRELKITEWQ